MPRDLPDWIYRHRLQVGNRVRALREARDLSQEELAHAVGLDRKTINRVETGTRTITGDQAVMIAAVLHVPVYWLFTDDWDIKPSGDRPDAAGGP